MSTTHFVDPVSLMLWLVFACLAVLTIYASRLACGIPTEKLCTLAAPLASVAIPLALLGGWMTITWPLTGSVNIVIGEPLLYFGSLLIFAAWLIAHDSSAALHELTLPASIGGLFLLVLAAAIAMNGIGQPPANEAGIGQPPISTLIGGIWAMAYASVGVSAISSRFLHISIWRRIGTVFLVLALVVFGLQAIISTLSHVGMFANWLPATIQHT